MQIKKHSLHLRPFKRVLIANRGEIALRVIRACREQGISPCVVYSEADSNSLHVALADAAVCIGPGPSSESYLSIPKIIQAARTLRADAIHPGYGFLSENADFAKSCFDAGIVWIGPSPESISAMGDKTIAKKLVSAAGVPCSPGKNDPLRDFADLQAVAAQIGLPLILKAAAGGGGRGMKVVRAPQDLAESFEACQREALAYFANKNVFCERFVERPRHVEVQIIGDSKGNIIYLFDRDCTIQRRHQKLFEEAPSAFISEETRHQMGQIAVRAAQQVGYVGAGTVEFLLESPTQFYFMEMNTRVQVEHPVTEEITGLDIIDLQFRAARGDNLGLEQDEVKIRGWACEARINAEDPYENFRPSSGKIEFLRFPSGPGVRVDSHIYPGYVIPPFYDSMIAKLITAGRNRQEALKRMARALAEFEIDGIETTIPFHQRLIENPTFLKGDYTTRFLEENTHLLDEQETLTSDDFNEDAENQLNPEQLLACVGALERTTGWPHVKNVVSGKSTSEQSPWITAARREANRRES